MKKRKKGEDNRKKQTDKSTGTNQDIIGYYRT